MAGGIDSTLFVMAKTGTHMPGIFVVLRAATTEQVQHFNARSIANTLWAMAKAGTHMPGIFEALRTAMTEQVQDVNV